MEASEIILQGRRYCESISGYELLEDLIWMPEDKCWRIKFSLTGNYAPTEFVPLITIWYAIFSENYPFGDLNILPASEGGIEATFPHMLTNKDIGRPWRSGNVCVKTNYGTWNDVFFNKEPYNVSRLQWSINRCKAWIRAAVDGNLQALNDPFEFPHFHARKKMRWIFSETTESFIKWNSCPDSNGILKFFIPEFNKNLLLVSDYRGENGTINSYEWGMSINYRQPDFLSALWYKLPEIPVEEPWQLPMKWGDLFELSEKKGWQLRNFLEEKLIKEKLLKKIKILTLGFPVEPYIGKGYERIHWFTILLPEIDKNAKGFRTDSPAWNNIQFLKMYSKSKNIQWLRSENWAKDQISARGSFEKDIVGLNICVIGVGAVGSYLAELLVRLGCITITLVDEDNANIGNFSRHTLTMSSISENKSVAVAKRLNDIFPDVSIKPINATINKVVDGQPDFFEKFDLIIDCTAEDDVLRIVEDYGGREGQVFLSVSLGMEAQSLLAYMSRSPLNNLFSTFKDKKKDWSNSQKQRFPNPVFPLEGIGCWHPIFPARIDDIHSLVASTIRQLEVFLKSRSTNKLMVIERKDNGEILIKEA